jgi:hypothetical protein
MAGFPLLALRWPDDNCGAMLIVCMVLFSGRWQPLEVDGAINLLQEMSIPGSLPGASVRSVSPRNAAEASGTGRVAARCHSHS